jgi:hypothetical protein
MIRRANIFAILACLALAAFAESPSDTVTIPLKDIWAYRMPGTKDVQELDNQSLSKILAQLRPAHDGQAPPFKQINAGQGFAVEGEGKTALQAVYKTLVDKQPQQSLTTAQDISVAFYSFEFSNYVHISNVERRGNLIEIEYHFIPHDSKNLTSHFALIPLGQLPAGEYDVQFKQLPLEKQYIENGYKSVSDEWVQRIICKPFRFSVKGK